MLARAGLGHHARSAQRFREQRLADAVVDFVRARVREVLALQPHVGAPALRQRRGVRERRRPADPGLELRDERALKLRRRQDVPHAVGQAFDRGHQRLRHEPATERAKPAVRVRQPAVE